MKRRLIWLAVLGLGIFMYAGCSSETSDQDSEKVKKQAVSSEGSAEAMEYDYMLIDKDVFKMRKKGAVRFTHDRHMDEHGLDCTDCHHDFQGGKNVWTEDDDVKTCESCHDPVEDRGKAYKLITAFHKNCRGCHRDVNEGGEEELAPVKCSGCHESKKS